MLRFIKETWQKDDTVAPVAKHEKKDATAVLSWDGEVCHDDFVRLQQQAKLDRNNLLAKIGSSPVSVGENLVSTVSQAA